MSNVNTYPIFVSILVAALTVGALVKRRRTAGDQPA